MFTIEDLHQLWFAAGGAILVLFQSIFTEDRRNWKQLLSGCVFGALGAWVASGIYEDSKYIILICGVAAVVSEHIMLGLVNASRQFSVNPLRVFTHLAKLLIPAFGKGVGNADVDKDLK